MKKILLFGLFLICFSWARAQAPAMDTTWLPHAGEKYYTFILRGQQHVPDNDSGAGVTWDFGDTFSLMPFHSDSLDFVLPATRYISCTNPLANFADGDSVNYVCYIKDSSGLKYADWKTYLDPQSGYYITHYSKPDVFIKGHFHFRQSYTDTSMSSYYFSQGHSAADSNWHSLQITQSKYDGYGILKIAGREFDTAVRVHQYVFEDDSLYGAGRYGHSYALSSIYTWYVPSMHVPVVMLQTYYEVRKTPSGFDTTATLHSNTMVLKAEVTPPVGPGHVDNLNTAQANYSDNTIFINGAVGDNISYALYDTDGRLIMTGNPRPAGKYAYTIQARDISQGMYILKIQNKSGQTRAIKLVKDR